MEKMLVKWVPRSIFIPVMTVMYIISIFNSLSPERYGGNFEFIILQHIPMIDIMRIESIPSEMALDDEYHRISLMVSQHWFM